MNNFRVLVLSWLHGTKSLKSIGSPTGSCPSKSNVELPLCESWRATRHRKDALTTSRKLCGAPPRNAYARSVLMNPSWLAATWTNTLDTPEMIKSDTTVAKASVNATKKVPAYWTLQRRTTRRWPTPTSRSVTPSWSRTVAPCVAPTKVIPSENIAPQHRLLVMDIHLKLGSGPKPRCTETERIKWWRFNECKDDLETKLGTMEVNLNQPAPDIYQKTIDKIRDRACDVLGTTKPGRKFIDRQVWWWNENVQEAIRRMKGPSSSGSQQERPSTTNCTRL